MKRSIYILCRYEFEYFSFFDIAVLFSAGNAKKNVFTVFTVPIVTIDGFKSPALVKREDEGEMKIKMNAARSCKKRVFLKIIKNEIQVRVGGNYMKLR